MARLIFNSVKKVDGYNGKKLVLTWRKAHDQLDRIVRNNHMEGNWECHNRNTAAYSKHQVVEETPPNRNHIFTSNR